MIRWTPGYTIESVEKEIIMQALSFYQGNKTQTAQALGIAIRTLDNKLAQYKKAVETKVQPREPVNEMRGLARQ
jgi:DNA-binding NtrC family response regulator